MSFQEALDKILAIIRARLAASAVPDWNLNGVMQALSATLPAGAQSGSCVYMVDGHPFCVDGITELECTQQLNGKFSSLPCSQRPK
jgi:hypothetical protein